MKPEEKLNDRLDMIELQLKTMRERIENLHKQIAGIKLHLKIG